MNVNGPVEQRRERCARLIRAGAAQSERGALPRVLPPDLRNREIEAIAAHDG